MMAANFNYQADLSITKEGYRLLIWKFTVIDRTHIQSGHTPLGSRPIVLLYTDMWMKSMLPTFVMYSTMNSWHFFTSHTFSYIVTYANLPVSIVSNMLWCPVFYITSEAQEQQDSLIRVWSKITKLRKMTKDGYIWSPFETFLGF